MPRSFSLTAYSALSRRGRAERFAPTGPRPEGQVIWMHATSPGRLAAMQDVARRLKAQNPGLFALITLHGVIEEAGSSKARGADWVVPFGNDTRGYARAFLDHWKPDICIWTGGHMLPNTINTARDAGVPLLLVDADEIGIQSGNGTWIPTLMRSTLSAFEHIFASNAETAQRLARKGVAPGRIQVTTPLQVSGNPPVSNEDEVDAAAAIIGGRLIWLAVHVQLEEVALILEAHLNAARLAHRLLLVMVPATGIPIEALREQVDKMNLRAIDWDAGDEPDDFTQVILTEGGSEIGLWYRLAPVTFVGSSLQSGFGGANPFDAAALGSAVLYGPNIRHHMASYTRLAGAGAARIVKDAEGLSAGVIRLIAPDQAASMALAAWEVVSEGAEITDQLLNLIQDMLDQRGHK